MMGNGNHMMGYGFYGGYILFFILLTLLATIIYVFVKNKKTTNPEVVRLITYLKYSYANGKISNEEYFEKKSILDSSDLLNPSVFELVEMYIKSDLTLKDLFKINKNLDSQSHNQDITVTLIKKKQL